MTIKDPLDFYEAYTVMMAYLNREFEPSREIALVKTKLEEAMMWFEKAVD